MPADGFTYRAFISYSHANRNWGAWLHRELERFRAPRKLVGDGDRKLGRCFRDEAEMGAAAHLPDKITKALNTTDWLVVICSPRSAASEWVNKEIRDFKALGREHRVLALIVEGTPGGSIDPEAELAARECFPQALRTRADGGVAEPLAVDVRKYGRADAIVRLVAEIIGVEYDALRQREVRRRRWAMIRAQALFAAGLVLTAGALAGGYFAAENYAAASEKKSELFAREAAALINEDQTAKAMLMALEGDPTAGAGWAEATLRPQGMKRARQAMLSALNQNRIVRQLEVGPNVVSAAVSGDARQILVGYDDGRAAAWDMSMGRKIVDLNPHNHPTVAAAISPDGTVWATGSWDRHVRIWSTPGFLLKDIDVGNAVLRLEFTPDGGTLIVGDSSGTIGLYPVRGDGPPVELSDPQTTVDANTGKSVFSISTTPDGQYIASGYSDGTVRMWRSQGGAPVLTFRAHSSAVNSIDISSSGTFLVTGAQNSEVNLWRLDDTAQPVWSLPQGDAITAVRFSPAGDHILVASQDGVATRYDLESREMGIWHSSSPAVLARFSTDGQDVILASEDGTTRMFAIASESGQRIVEGDDATLSFDRQTVAAYRDGEIVLTDVASGEVRATIKTSLVVWSLAFSADGARILANSERGSIIYSTQTGEVVAVPRKRYGFTDGILTADGGLVLSGETGAAAVFYDAQNGESVRRLEAIAKPDQRFGSSVTGIVFADDGSRVAGGAGDYTAMIWSAADGRRLATLEGHTKSITGAAFSTDGNWLLTGSTDRTAKLWNTAGGPATATFRGQSEMRAVDFAPAAVRSSAGVDLLAADYRGVGLWTRDGLLPVAYLRSAEGVRAAAFMPDGRSVFIAEVEHGARLVPLPAILFAAKGEQVRTTCEQLLAIGFEDFTEADWQRFPILDRHAPHPCGGVWGFDPRKGDTAKP